MLQGNYTCPVITVAADLRLLSESFPQKVHMQFSKKVFHPTQQRSLKIN